MTPTPTPSPSPLACVATGPASASWPGPVSSPNAAPPIVSVVAAGDVLTLTFVQGTPSFEVKQQAGSQFSQDPSGKPVTLAGSAGAMIVLRGFRGDMRNYTGPASVISSGPLLLQAYALGDFEGVVTWAVGLSGPGCANVTAAGSNLTFHFIPPPA